MSDRPKNDRPIDHVRNSAGGITLPEDAGGIDGMCEINNSLHMIGRKAIYQIQLADEIDPDRTNITIPNTQQKVLAFGTESPLVRQILMTAKRMFSNSALGPNFDSKVAINLAFDALQDVTAMYTMREELRAKLRVIEGEAKNLTIKQRALAMPHVGDVRSVAEAFLQKADHATVGLFNIAKLFYGNAIGQRWFQSLYKLILEKNGEDDPFTKFLAQVLPFLQFVRNARNAMEHSDATKSVKVTDITLSPAGELHPPSIEVIHPDTPKPTTPLEAVMSHTIDHLGAISELMMVYLCGCNVQPSAGLKLSIIAYDEDQQDAYKCRYGYGAQIGGQIVPFG